jgi:hypothetical protein
MGVPPRESFERSFANVFAIGAPCDAKCVEEQLPVFQCNSATVGTCAREKLEINIAPLK